MEIKSENLAIIGDIHGEFSEIVWEIVNKYKIENTAFIVAGDFGIGFDNSLESLYKNKLEKNLEKSQNLLLGIRGNHDNPEYFRKDNLINYEFLKTIPDYTHLTWKNRKILVIGGGVSIDQSYRKEYNETHEKKIWWEDERITQNLELVNEKEDIIISHMAPLIFGPVLTRDNQESYEIWREDKEDREYLTEVVRKSNPRNWFFGHYHKSTSGDYSDCIWRGLDIKEIYEIR